MKNIHILSKLATLKKKECIHKIFNFNFFNEGEVLDNGIIPNCKTIGCLAGELPAIDPIWSFNTNGGLLYKHYSNLSTSLSLSEYFDLPLYIIQHIFYPYNQDKQIDPNCKDLYNNSTFEEVQNNLKSYLTHNNIDYLKLSKS